MVLLSSDPALIAAAASKVLESGPCVSPPHPGSNDTLATTWQQVSLCTGACLVADAAGSCAADSLSHSGNCAAAEAACTLRT